MNTTDRSLARIDYALRRRFSFFEMNPAFELAAFQNDQKALHNKKLDKLIEEIKKLNQEIRKDKSLGKGFCIGHSYFCGCKRPGDCTDAWLQSIVDYDILPMLEEYWFDDESAGRLREWQDRLHKAIAPKADGVSQ